jgi:DNA-binding NtrC family response regulator
VSSLQEEGDRKEVLERLRTEGYNAPRFELKVYAEDGNLRTLHDIEMDIINFAISHYGCMTEVARRLHISRSTLYRKMEVARHE